MVKRFMLLTNRKRAYFSGYPPGCKELQKILVYREFHHEKAAPMIGVDNGQGGAIITEGFCYFRNSGASAFWAARLLLVEAGLAACLKSPANR
ncbi:MAG: hypothetical protein WCS32_07355 [Candidatus Izemoplasmatales bacterium]|jgi:hypothetical protein